MQYDFSRIDDIDSFISIPEGRYTCRVAEVREGVSREGSPRWSLRLEVALGDFAGRTAGWDSVTWSERGIRRVKHVLEALGLDVSGHVEIAPSDLLGREVVAVFHSEEREDAFTGRRVLRLRVPYAGYTPAPSGGANGGAHDPDFGEASGGSSDGSSGGSSGGPSSTASSSPGPPNATSPNAVARSRRGDGGAPEVTRGAGRAFDDEFED